MSNGPNVIHHFFSLSVGQLARAVDLSLNGCTVQDILFTRRLQYYSRIPKAWKLGLYCFASSILRCTLLPLWCQSPHACMLCGMVSIGGNLLDHVNLLDPFMLWYGNS